jgi:WD40 repeat protein
MAFHPTEEKPIVFAGDKEGALGVFDASQSAPKVEDDDEEAEYPDPVISAFKTHSRTISSIQFSPIDGNVLYTGSYDSSIRRLDIVKEMSTEIFSPGDAVDEQLISATDIADSDPNIIYFSTIGGALGRHDVRTKASEAEIWELLDNKIGGFSLHPVHSHLVATASLDRTLKIWDLRKVNGRGNMRLPALMGEHTSRLSVSHAAWSSTGHIATTSYDDTIKIYDFTATAGSWKPGQDLSEDDMEPAVKVSHNNQTGRWVTILKPQWQRNPVDGIQRLAIGNMNRFVDIYAADGQQLAQLDGEGITAVPAVAIFHPTKEWVAGGNASGKLALWM